MSSSDAQSLTSEKLRAAFSAFPTGVVAVCAVVDGVPAGMAMSSFTSISLDPPLVALSVARTSTTWPKLRDRAELGVSVLGREQAALCRQLSAVDTDRFAGVAWSATGSGAVHLQGAALWLTASLTARYDGGDHTIELLSLTDVTAFGDVEPLLFHRSSFRDLIPVE